MENNAENITQAGPTRCPLAKDIGEPPSEIEKRIDEFFEELYINPLPVPNSLRPSFLTAGTARGERFLLF